MEQASLPACAVSSKTAKERPQLIKRLVLQQQPGLRP